MSLPSSRSAPLPAGVLAAGVLLVMTTTACSDGTAAGGRSSGSAVTVTASDKACDVSRTDLPAGTSTFTVTNKGTAVTEFYVYGTGDRVLAEVENIAPGLTREVMAELPAGTYQATCKPGMTGNGVRTALTVTGKAAASSENAALAGVGMQYQAYVRTQAVQLLARTTDFVAAVKAKDVPRAKALYPQARLYWERIEPVAESFGNLDPLIDGREADQDPGQDFTGFHRIEKALWKAGNVNDMGRYADQLLANVQKIAAQAREVALTPLQIATGAKSLLDEIATGKITGEEDRYSHTDLWDFAGNLDGVAAGVTVLRPFLTDADPRLLAQIDQRLTAVRSELGKFRAGSGWVSYDRLDQTQLRALSDSVTALTESVSRVAADVAKR